MHEDPKHWNQSLAAAIPASAPTHHFDTTAASSIPIDLQELLLFRAANHLRGTGQFVSLDSGSSFTSVRLRRSDQVGIGVELADQGQSPPVPRGKPGQIMCGIIAVRAADKLPVGKPTQQ